MTTAIFGVVSVNYGRAAPTALRTPAGCSPAPDIDSVKSALASVNKLYGEAYRTGDSSLFLNCYTPDGAVMAAHAPVLHNRNELLLFYKAAYQTSIRNVVFTTVELYGLTNEYVTEQGVYELFDADNHSLGKGKYLVLWKKTAAGWKRHRDMFNGDSGANG